MYISPFEEYGVRCAVQLARVAPEAHLSASRVAELEGISVEYVSKIMYVFRQAKLVKAVRGVQGGFQLARRPQEISVKQVVDSLHLKRKIDEDFCKQYTGQLEECIHLKSCSIRPVWLILSVYLGELLNELTLGDFLSPEDAMIAKVRRLGAENAAGFKQTLIGTGMGSF